MHAVFVVLLIVSGIFALDAFFAMGRARSPDQASLAAVVFIIGAGGAGLSLLGLWLGWIVPAAIVFVGCVGFVVWFALFAPRGH